MSDLTSVKNAVTELNEEEALTLVKQALAANIPAFEVLQACQEAMAEVGRRFECQDYFVSDLMMSGEIFKQISAVLAPHLQAGGSRTVGKVVFGTVKGDIHDIGKDIVVNMLKSSNFEVIDLGVDVAPQRFVDAVKESGARIVGLSGLLTLAFDSMKATVAAFEAAGMRDSVKVMVGGGPVDANVCRVVGANDWGADAQQAIRLAKRWTEEVANA